MKVEELKMANTDYSVKTFIEKLIGNFRVSEIRKKLIDQREVRLNICFIVLILE